jgi:hypothetical protein
MYFSHDAASLIGYLLKYGPITLFFVIEISDLSGRRCR